MRPWSMTMTWSHWLSIHSCCVTKMRVRSLNRPFTQRDHIALATSKSSAEKGSSMSTTSALEYTACASATLCCWPPLSVTPFRPTRV
mmetsp:Transcript_25777/g.74347  ORF Transcript_25777/g.74347 Transcript_25777/m.74347 type:complete len:87 (-) Transcript_25777:227-487(-)